MILFLCSLVANAVNFVRRQQLASSVNSFLSKPGSLMLRRVPATVRAIQSWSSVSLAQQGSENQAHASPRPNINHDIIEISHSPVVEKLDLTQWHCFDLALSQNKHCSDQKPTWPSVCQSSVVYFVGKLIQHGSIGAASTSLKYPVESKCLPMAWTTQDATSIKILFACPITDFAAFVCDWKEDLVFYRDNFDIVEMKTVELNKTELEQIDRGVLRGLPFHHIENQPVQNDEDQFLSWITPSNQRPVSGIFKGLEQLCLSDILSAKKLCENLSTYPNDNESSSKSSDENSLGSTANLVNVITVQPGTQDSELNSINIDFSNCAQVSPPGILSQQLSVPSPYHLSLSQQQNPDCSTRCPSSIYTLSPVDELDDNWTHTAGTSGSDLMLGNPLGVSNQVRSPSFNERLSMTSLLTSERDEEFYQRRKGSTDGFNDKSFRSTLDRFEQSEAEKLAERSRSLTCVNRSTSVDASVASAAPHLAATLPRKSRRNRTTSSSHHYSTYDTVTARHFSSSVPVLCQNGSIESHYDPKIRRMSSIRRLSVRGLKEPVFSKPPNVLVYCGRDETKSEKTFQVLKSCLNRILDTRSQYVVYKLEHEKFLLDCSAWRQNVTCLILADLSDLGEKHWDKLFDFFRSNGKLVFFCENRLVANLKQCDTPKQRYGLLKKAFDASMRNSLFSGFLSSNHSNPFERDFDKFLKKVSKMIDGGAGSISEQTRVNDPDGRLKYYLTILKEPQSPLIFYLQNERDKAGALFTDMTLSSLDVVDQAAGLLRQIFERLDIATMDLLKENSKNSNDQTFSMPKLSEGYFIVNPKFQTRDLIAMHLLERQSTENIGIKMEFRMKQPNNEALVANENYLPIFFAYKPGSLPESFNFDAYFSNLRSTRLGQCVLFVETITSTIPVCNSFAMACPNDQLNFIVISRSQIAGKGRGGNKWLSPLGCAMFSFMYESEIGSKVAQHAGYVQHLLALAIVDSIRSLPGLQNIDLRIKWPNDIYCGRTAKLGGILAHCSVKGNKFLFNISCGLNVSNSKPTLCVNDLLPFDIDSDKLDCDQVIALTLSRFEVLIDLFEKSGPDSILPLYYKYWLHDRQELGLSQTKEHVIVRGLDEHGYLQVRSRQSGRLLSVQPDGNSLDMMHNLIMLK